MSTVKMTPLYGGKSREEWDEEWETLKGGFAAIHPEVHGMAGLYRARMGERTFFVGCSSAPGGARLYTRLISLKNQPQSANRHYGALKIRENIEALSLDVICLGKSWKHCAYTVALKNSMVRHHQPAWNVRKLASKQ